MLNMWQISISTFSNPRRIIKFSVRHKNNKKNKPHNWSVAGWRKSENVILQLMKGWSFEAWSFTVAITIYFKFRFKLIYDLVNRDRIWTAMVISNEACFSRLVFRKSSYWLEWTWNRLVKKMYVVRQMLLNTESTSIKSILDSILSNRSSYLETRAIFFNCKMK